MGLDVLLNLIRNIDVWLQTAKINFKKIYAVTFGSHLSQPQGIVVSK